MQIRRQRKCRIWDELHLFDDVQVPNEKKPHTHLILPQQMPQDTIAWQMNLTMPIIQATWLMWKICWKFDTIYVTRFHKMSLNLKFGNLKYLHVSNLQVLLVILILKSHIYSQKMWMWCVSEGCMCGRGHFEKISLTVFTVKWVVFPLVLSNRRFKCTNLYQFWHTGAPEETWNFNIS